MKYLGIPALATGMLLSGALPALTITSLVIHAAQEITTPGGIVDLKQGGAAITIEANEGQSLIGKKFRLYQLFSVKNAAHLESVNYTWTPAYQDVLQKVIGKRLNKPAKDVTEYEAVDYIQSLNNHKVEGAVTEQKLEGRYSEFRYFIEEITTELRAQKKQGTDIHVTQTMDNGNIRFDGLDFGYYITDEISDNAGTHSASSLCMVNTANPNAAVKIKSDYPSITKKILEDDHKEEIGADGWNDIADYEIGQTVPYRYDTAVPDMNGYHTYYFAFHDKMDKALTFDPDTVKIQIMDGKKTYDVDPSEYNILENVGGTTFKIEIEDLKKIVDREFPEGMNKDKENIYGQKIVLRYDAKLNDEAAKDTGRPGFENSVKLEFSNDPDADGVGKTGETPWDTVVCFTYKLNVSKVNDHDAPLKDARFRLYSDADCTKEVYLKRTPDGYNVINRDAVGGNDHDGGTQPNEAVEIVTPLDGNFTIYGLDQGVYYLSEVDAPDGYRKLLDPIVLTVRPTYTNDRNSYVAGEGATDKILQKLEATAHFKEFYDGATSEKDNKLEADATQGSMNLTVVNKVGSKLPVTGSQLTIVMVALGAGLMIAGYGIHRKRSHVDDGK